MSKYDLLIGLNSARLNEVIESVFQSDPYLFSGTASGEYGGVQYRLKWTVAPAPTIDLRPPTDSEWLRGIKADGTPVVKRSNAFIVDIPRLELEIDAPPEPLSTIIPVQVICEADSQSSKLTLRAVAVIINLKNATPFDQFTIQAILIPGILGLVNQLISGVDIQPPPISGVSLSAPLIDIRSGYLLLAFSSNGGSEPNLDDFKLPADPFFILCAPQLMSDATNYQVKENLQGKTSQTSGKVSAGGFNATYKADGKLSQLVVESTDNPSTFNTSVSLSMSASGGIDIPVDHWIDEAGRIISKTATDIGDTITNPDTWNPSKW